MTTKARELTKQLRTALKAAGVACAHYNAGGWQRNIDGWMNPGYVIKPRRAGVVTVAFDDGRSPMFDKRTLATRIEDSRHHREQIKRYAEILRIFADVEIVDEGLSARPYLRCTAKAA